MTTRCIVCAKKISDLDALVIGYQDAQVGLNVVDFCSWPCLKTGVVSGKALRELEWKRRGNSGQMGDDEGDYADDL